MSRSVTYNVYLNGNVREALIANEQAALRLDGVMERLRYRFLAIGATFASYGLFNLGKDIVETTAKFETLDNVIKYSSENLKEYNRNKEFLKNIINDLKLPIFQTTEAYSKLSAALMGTNVTSQQTRDIFEGISIASRVLHLDGDATSRVFLALEQMISKTKVSAEELRRQLGNAMPGAVRLFAESLNMSQGELLKRMKEGTVFSETSVPLFAQHLKEVFEGGIPQAVQSLQAQMAELNNLWIETKKVVGDDLRPEIIELIGNIKDVVIWIKENRTELIEWGKIIIKIAEYWVAYRVAIWGVRLAVSGYRIIANWLLGNTVAQTTAVTSQQGAYVGLTAAVNAATAAIERLNFVQNASSAKFITNAAGITAANTAANRYLLSASGNAVAGMAGGAASGTAAGALGAGVGAVGTFVGGALLVALTAASVAALVQGLETINDTDGVEVPWYRQFTDAISGKTIWQSKVEQSLRDVSQIDDDQKYILAQQQEMKKLLIDLGIYSKEKYSDEVMNATISKYFMKWDSWKRANPDANLPESPYMYRVKNYGNALGKRGRSPYEEKMGLYSNPNDPQVFAKPMAAEITRWMNNLFNWSHGLSPDDDKNDDKNKNKNTGLTVENSSKLRGNTVTTFNIRIDEMNGIKQGTFSVKNMSDMDKIKEQIGEEVTRILTAAVNDSQHLKRN